MKVASLVLLAAFIASAQQVEANYEAHEWGTFTSLVGSNGITQHGMYHEDEALPQFVHGFGDVRPPTNSTPPPRREPCLHPKMCVDSDFFANNIVTQKMETPVIYFYGQPQKLTVNVRFPQGVITDTYPAPVFTSPTRQDLKKLGNGNTTFEIELLAAKQDGLGVQIPTVSPTEIYGHARNVASQLVRSGREVEKFIFYRGLGRFQPRFGITSKNGSLFFSSNPASQPLAGFLVHVNAAGNAQLLDMSLVKGGLSQSLVGPTMLGLLADHQSQTTSEVISRGSAMRTTLIKSLVSNGLNMDEATAMIDTWENGYLKVPGLRLLYILPKAEVDEVLPLTITPAPDKLERVFIGRIEILLDTEEDRIQAQVLRERDAFNVRTLGRFAEPILRRVYQVYTEDAQLTGGIRPENIELFERLIQQTTKSETPSGLL